MAYTHCLVLKLKHDATSTVPEKLFTVDEADVESFVCVRAVLVAYSCPAEVFDQWTSISIASRDDPNYLQLLVVINVILADGTGRLLQFHARIEKAPHRNGGTHCDPHWKGRLIQEIAQGRLNVQYEDHK